MASLTPAQFAMLCAIQKGEDPERFGDRWDPHGRGTGFIECLVRRGLVSRDLRRYSLTPEGEHSLAKAEAAHAKRNAKKWASEFYVLYRTDEGAWKQAHANVIKSLDFAREVAEARIVRRRPGTPYRIVDGSGKILEEGP